jgi:hypothetical protein
MYYILVLTENKKELEKYSGFAYGFTIILKFVIMLFLIVFYIMFKKT